MKEWLKARPGLQGLVILLTILFVLGYGLWLLMGSMAVLWKLGSELVLVVVAFTTLPMWVDYLPTRKMVRDKIYVWRMNFANRFWYSKAPLWFWLIALLEVIGISAFFTSHYARPWTLVHLLLTLVVTFFLLATMIALLAIGVMLASDNLEDW